MTPRFTLRQVHYFVAVAEFGSISRASENIHVSPPSLSTAIGQLEATFGLQLFIRRHSQGLCLTASGRRFLSEAKQLMSQAVLMHRSANEMTSQLSGPVSVGCHVALSAMLLPTVRQTFTALHEEAIWSSMIGDQGELVSRLRAGDLDVALTDELGLPGDVAFDPLASLPVHAVFAADHPLAGEPAVSLRTLSRLPLILLDMPHVREHFLSLFDDEGLRPSVLDRVADHELVRAMVANGLGYSLAAIRPANMAAADGKPLLMKPLVDAHRPVTIGLGHMHDDHRPRLISNFVECCRNLIHEDMIPGMAPLDGFDPTRLIAAE